MFEQLMQKVENGEAVNITFTKKDGSTSHARIIESPAYEAKTDRVKVDAPDGYARLFCEERNRWVMVEKSTIIF